MIPISTDAPIYHYPATTTALITANFICFAATGYGNPDLTEAWVLKFGELDPLQWLSSMFAHLNAWHLVGNMMFLWAFGLIVEGKIGWLKMAGLYMGIGLAQSAFVQLIMYPWPGATVWGASAAIMGIMAISMIWAPKNELKIFYFFWFLWIIRAGFFEVTIMSYAIFYLVWDVIVFVLFDTGGMGTAAHHLSGAVIGSCAGVLFMKCNWVDCENWDIFRVMTGNYGRFVNPSTTVGSHANPEHMFGKSDVSVSDDLPENSLSVQHRERLQKIVEQINNNDVMGASEDLLLLRMEDSDAVVNEPALKKLIMGLLRADMPEDGEIYMEEYIERFPEQCSWARVRLAHMQLQMHKQPRAALKTLKQVRLSQLSSEQQQTAKKIVAAARKRINAGIKDAEHEW